MILLIKQSILIAAAEKAANALLSLWDDEKTPTCIEILQAIKSTGLFKLSDRIIEILGEPQKPSIESLKKPTQSRTNMI